MLAQYVEVEEVKQEKKRSMLSFDYDDKDKSPIAIRHKRLKNTVKYNPDTGVFTSRVHEGIRVRGGFDKNGYLTVSFLGRKALAHRLAWFYMTGKYPKKIIDHINGNTSDNRFSNLREANPIDNSHNLKLSKLNKSGARGVHFAESDQKWVARICRSGKWHSLGRYKDKKKAIAAVNNFTKKNDGEFFSEATSKRNLGSDSIKTLAQLKRKLALGKSKNLDMYQTIFMENLLNSWGAWAYSELKEKTLVSPLVKLMASSDGYGSINGDGLVQIFEGLHKRGYSGDELIKKAAKIIAAIKHREYEACTDIEASFIDRMIIKTFGRNNAISKVAIYYYIYGHNKQSIAEYIAKITNHELTIKQCRDRVKWCLDFFKEKLYLSIEYETKKNDNS